MQVRVPFLRPRGARRGGAYDGGHELAGSVGQNAERQETRDDARRPLRDGNPASHKLLKVADRMSLDKIRRRITFQGS